MHQHHYCGTRGCMGVWIEILEPVGLPRNHDECSGCGRILSGREMTEQPGVCIDCQGGC